MSKEAIFDGPPPKPPIIVTEGLGHRIINPAPI